jgi:SEC-C motif-containing protein
MAGRARHDAEVCPCGSGAAFAACCKPFLDGQAIAPTAEALMRSRYSAYVLGQADYLRQTWHSDYRPAALDLDARQNWLGLKVLRTEQGNEGDNEGVVEFVARFKISGRGHRLHEISRFEKVDGRWLYLDGARGGTDSSLRT